MLLRSRRSFRPTLRLVLLLTFVAGAPAAGETPGPAPAATLLLPYFEVDLTSSQGLTTLFSVNNAGAEQVVAHVVVWTDWGIPTYSFDFALAPDDVQTINLRDLFTAGAVPATDGTGFPSCANPVAVPPVDLPSLLARHTGQADPGDTLCYGSGRQGQAVATGYVTVDVVKRCSGTELYFPIHTNYFPNFAIGTPNPDSFLIANHNVLWGDAFYVAGGDESAQGIELVPIPALEEATFGGTFYRLYSPEGYDVRALLGTRYRGRFMNGGAFDGGTELLVWLEPHELPEPVTCGAAAIDSCPDAVVCRQVEYRLFDEAASETATGGLPITEVAFRLPVGNGPLAPSHPFGSFELQHFTDFGPFPPVERVPYQAWVTSVMRAEGRYSVALSVTRLPAPQQ